MKRFQHDAKEEKCVNYFPRHVKIMNANRLVKTMVIYRENKESIDSLDKRKPPGFETVRNSEEDLENTDVFKIKIAGVEDLAKN